MSIKVYHIPPGNRKFKENLFRTELATINGPDYSEILYLAPTRHLVRQWRNFFHDATDACYVPPGIMTLKQLANRLVATHGNRLIVRGALRPSILAGLEGCHPGFAQVVSQFISEMKAYFPSEPFESLNKRFDEIFRDLGLPEEVARRIREALNFLAGYDEAIGSAGAMDEGDLMVEASRHAANIKAELLILDGFYEITPAEEQLIHATIRQASHTLASIPTSDENDDLTYCYSINLKYNFNIEAASLPDKAPSNTLSVIASPSMEEELEGIARQIKGDFVTGKERRLDKILLVFPDLMKYRALTERVFERYGIPVDVTSSQPLSRTRPYRDLLSLLDAVLEDYPRLAFCRLLTSSHFEKIPSTLKKIIPSISLDGSIVKGKDAWRRAFRFNGLGKEGNWVLKVLHPLENISQGATYTDFATELLKVLKTLGFRLSEASDEGLTGLETTLRGLRAVDTVINKTVDLSSFRDALGNLLESLSGEAEGAGVKVSELREVRGLDPVSLYMGGLKDGDIPSRPDMDLLLPESVRKRLGLADMERHLRLQEHIFKRLTRTSDSLYLTYPTMDGDGFFLPSHFLVGAKDKMEHPFGLFSREEETLKRGTVPLAENITEVAGIPGISHDSAISVTLIDRYRACPRKFFIEHTLNLEPPEMVDYEMEARTLGIVIHKVMEKLIPLGAEDLESFSKNSSAVLQEVMLDSPLDGYYKALLKETFMDLVPRIFEIEQEIKATGFSFSSAEYRVTGEPIENIKLTGTVDRIDNSPGGALEIIDYKTGDADLSGTKVLKKGATLQLFLYAAMMKAKGICLEQVGIYSLKNMNIKWVPGKRDRKQGLTLDDYIEASLGFLRETAENMQKGYFGAHPLEDHVCWRCSERPYCPYIQRGASHATTGR